MKIPHNPCKDCIVKPKCKTNCSLEWKYFSEKQLFKAKLVDLFNMLMIGSIVFLIGPIILAYFSAPLWVTLIWFGVFGGIVIFNYLVHYIIMKG